MRSGGWGPGMELLPSLVSFSSEAAQLSPHPRKDTAGRQPTASGAAGPHQTPTTLALICRLPASRNLSTPQAAVFYYAAQADSDTQASSFRNGSLLSPAASSLPSASTSSSSLKHPRQDRPSSLCVRTQASVADSVILTGQAKNTGVPI